MCSRPFRPLGFAHLCCSRPRGSILATPLAALPSMSLTPFAPFLRALRDRVRVKGFAPRGLPFYPDGVFISGH